MTIVVHLHSPEAGVASLNGRFVRIDQGRWACPFKPGRDGTRLECFIRYEEWLKTQPELMDALPELRDKVLGCWCKVSGTGSTHGQTGRPCHGDVLARLVNERFPGPALPWDQPREDGA